MYYRKRKKEEGEKGGRGKRRKGKEEEGERGGRGKGGREKRGQTYFQTYE